MTPDDRLYRAIDGHVPDRVPVVPKIWVDLAARLTGTDLPEVIADPFTALRVIGQAGRMCRADAVRSSTFPVDAFSKATDEYGRWTATGTRSGRSTCRGGHTALRFLRLSARGPRVRSVPPLQKLRCPDREGNRRRAEACPPL